MPGTREPVGGEWSPITTLSPASTLDVPSHHAVPSQFATKMAVDLTDDGPFTIWLDTDA